MKKATRSFMFLFSFAIMGVVAFFVLNGEARAKGIKHYVVAAYHGATHVKDVATVTWNGSRQ